MTSVSEISPADLIIIGGGPAGMAAAAAALASRQAARVVLIDGNRNLGGQYWRQPFDEGLAVKTRRHHHHLGKYQQLKQELLQGESDGALTLLLGRWVWTVTKDAETGIFTAHTTRGDVAEGVQGKAVVLAAGAFDRQLPFPGWDLPGVVTAGGAQALLKSNDVLVGKRVAVGGTGPFLIAVATGLAEAGADIVGVHEANSYLKWAPHVGRLAGNPSKLIEGAELGFLTAKHRIPIRTRSAIIEARGRERVEQAVVARLDAGGKVLEGTGKVVDVDAIAVGWGFTAQIELALALGAETRVDVDGTEAVAIDDLQRATVDGLFAAGETCGIGGLELALIEGEIAGATAVGESETVHPLTKRRGRLQGFATAMHHAHPVTDHWESQLTADTIICRCEEVTFDRVSQAGNDPLTNDPRSTKLVTRTGMGWCQGRMCGYAASCLSTPTSSRGTDAFARRPVAAPVSLGALAAMTQWQSPADNRESGNLPETTDSPTD